MRLIDKQKVQTEIALIAKYLAKSDAQKAIIGRILFMIDHMPTIEPEVQLAHWIPGKRGKWSCSCCGNEIYCTSADDLQRNHEFCGHCGAEMKDQCDMRTLIEEAIL